MWFGMAVLMHVRMHLWGWGLMHEWWKATPVSLNKATHLILCSLRARFHSEQLLDWSYTFKGRRRPAQPETRRIWKTQSTKQASDREKFIKIPAGKHGNKLEASFIARRNLHLHGVQDV